MKWIGGFVLCLFFVVGFIEYVVVYAATSSPIVLAACTFWTLGFVLACTGWA
jgi:hypothetical protein